MSNMSYCRFQNTVRDLDDCKDAIEEAGDLDALLAGLSQEEHRAAEQLIGICREIVELVGEQE